MQLSLKMQGIKENWQDWQDGTSLAQNNTCWDQAKVGVTGLACSATRHELSALSPELLSPEP